MNAPFTVAHSDLPAYTAIMSLRVVSLAILAAAFASPLDKAAREACNPCNPSGATGSNPPSVGSDLKSLYTDVLESVKDIHFDKRWADPVELRADGFCCAETLDCVNVHNLNIPMCYDKFTTNFAFPDGSYGSLTTGDYTQGESEANLFTGQYTKNGSEGNIYSDDPSAKPNTATLSIPPQWTDAGAGSAIPPTAIAGSATAPAETSVHAKATTATATTSEATGSSSSASVPNSQAAPAASSPGAAVRGHPVSGTLSFTLSLATLLCMIYGL